MMRAMNTAEELATVARDGVEQDTVDAVAKLSGAYKYGWNTEIEMDYAPLGVNPDIVRLISSKNEEPQWMTDWRLQAFARWEKLEEPTWAMVHYPKIDFQSQYYYSVEGASIACWRRGAGGRTTCCGRCRVRFGFCRHDLSG